MSGIIRVKKDARYFVASNEPFNDERLSWEARGVMGYLLSKPDGWECRNRDLVNKGDAGRDKITRILGELKEYGYMRRYKYRDNEGKFRWVTEIFESPSLNTKTIHAKSVDGSPVNGSPVNGKGVDLTNTDSPNTDSINTEEEAPPEKKFGIGPVTDLLTGKQVSEDTAPNPQDQWFEYSDQFIKLFHRKTKRYPNEDEKQLISEFVGSGKATPEQWQHALSECNLHYTGQKVPVPRVIEVCEAGSYEQWKANKWPDKKDGNNQPATGPVKANDELGGWYV